MLQQQRRRYTSNVFVPAKALVCARWLTALLPRAICEFLFGNRTSTEHHSGRHSFHLTSFSSPRRAGVGERCANGTS